MNKKKRGKQWLEYFILSLAIHILLFYFWGSEMGIFQTRIIDPSQPVELYTFERERQIVNIDEDTNEPPNPSARFLSKSNRKVEKQTRAREWGKPKNARSQTFYSVEEQETAKAVDEFVKSKREKAQQNETSQTYDYLPDIAPGEQTILNTAEFIYYSFYRRVEEAIVPLWNDYISAYINTHPDVREKLRKKEYITEVQIVMDREGNFRRLLVVKSSGVAGFDKAPSYAFAEASPFENPPKGMINDNGTLTMKWRFVVSIVESVRYGVEYMDAPYNNRRMPDPSHMRELNY
ncbi:MAG: TonB C-terminal domain-containing protein [Oligoflexia bacterium]|nr:TonB C-terminal domain-containing protein [Oligoflexia bacterium]